VTGLGVGSVVVGFVYKDGAGSGVDTAAETLALRDAVALGVGANVSPMAVGVVVTGLGVGSVVVGLGVGLGVGEGVGSVVVDGSIVGPRVGAAVKQGTCSSSGSFR